jgi:membrane protein
MWNMGLDERLRHLDLGDTPGWRAAPIVAARFAVALWEQIARDRIVIRASGLAYTSLLATVPLVAVLFALFSAFSSFDDLRGKVERLLFSQFLPVHQDEIVTYINQFTANTNRLGFLGFLFLIVTSIMLLDSIESSVNDIWHVAKRRGFVSKITAYTSVLVFGTVLIGASVSLSARIKARLIIDSGFELSVPAQIGSWLGPLALTLLAFLLMYLVIPFTRVRLASAALGALVAGSLWEAGKNVFASSVGQSVQYSTIYGSLAVVPIFLIWLYVTWIIVLLGVEISFTHQHFVTLVRQRRLGPVRGSDQVLLALRVFVVAGSRFERGTEPPTADELADQLLAPMAAVERELEHMVSAGLLRQTTTAGGADGYLPARPLDTTNASEIIRAVFADATLSPSASGALERTTVELLSRFQGAGHAAIAEVSAREVALLCEEEGGGTEAS